MKANSAAKESKPPTAAAGDPPEFVRGQVHRADTPSIDEIVTEERLRAVESGLFFIVGPPRSGTTLMQAMLNAHPGISIPPETEFFMHSRPNRTRSTTGDVLQRSRSTSHVAIARWLDGQAFREQGIERRAFEQASAMVEALRPQDTPERKTFLALMAMHQHRSGATRVGEKSPHHARYVMPLSRTFTDAKFIFMIRDPRGTVASRLRVPWHRGRHFAAAREWRDLVDLHCSYAVCNELRERYLLVRMEDLIANPHHELLRVCNLLGEQFDPAMLAFQQRNEAGFDARENAWKARTLRPLDPSAVESWQTELTPRQQAGIERVVGIERMRGLGYEPRWFRGAQDATGISVTQRLTWGGLDAVDRSAEVLSRWQHSIAKRMRVSRKRSTT